MHWVVANYMLRYLIGIVNYGLNYERRGGIELIGYVDSNRESSAMYKKITYMFFLAWVWKLCRSSTGNKI